MTKEELKQKIAEMKKDNNKHIDAMVKKILSSGCIDLDTYENNYILPKIIMTACCVELSKRWQPITDTLRKEVKNIMLFI